MSFQQEYIRCGKPRCRCMNGGAPHGPYWFEYWRDDKTGRVRSRYVGKTMDGVKTKGAKVTSAPPPKSKRKASPPPPPPPPPRGDVPPRFAWDGRRMSIETAHRILGIVTSSRDAVMKAYRALVRDYHPDKAKTDAERHAFTEILKAVNRAKATLLG